MVAGCRTSGTIEFDMHGVIAKNGLYFEETSGAVAVSIEFQ